MVVNKHLVATRARGDALGGGGPVMSMILAITVIDERVVKI